MMKLCDDKLDTPCLLVDAARLQRNAQRAHQHAKKLRVSLRPHLKTVKNIEAARLAMPSANGPATVATLAEAEYFAEHGVEDLLYAVGISPQKLGRVASLRRQGCDLKIVVDNMVAAQAVAEMAKQCGPIPTLIELDVDGHRSGVSPSNRTMLFQLGTILSDSGSLAGVMTHAGGSYQCADAGSLSTQAENERAKAVEAAGYLREHQRPCSMVSVGSTPTFFSLESSDGLTEVRAGVYLFFDLFQAGVGVCREDEIALSVLATVIGHQASKGWIITDAGWTALSADRSTASQRMDQGFGRVCDLDGNPIDELIVISTNQEHGIVAPRPGSEATRPEIPVGTRLRILPNHACATAQMHRSYRVVDESRQVVAEWPRMDGW